MSKKLIYTSYSPNSRKKDLTLNWKILFSPSEWFEGEYVDKITQFFEQHYPGKKSYTYNYARSALYHLLKHIEPEEGDEIIFQGFTCAASSLPAIWAGYKPIYVDIESSTLSPSLESISDAITENTKFIVVQYTLGLQPSVEEIVKLAQSKGILVIEDCTHFLPRGEKCGIGTYGDFSIFSFGRDKVASGVDGGVLLINNQEYNDLLDTDYDSLPYPSKSWVIKRIKFPIVWDLIKRTYTTADIGKALHLFFTKSGLLTTATSREEKMGEKPDSIPALLPNSLAEIADAQLDDIDALQNHREKIGKIYSELLSNHPRFTLIDNFQYPPLRFPILHDKRDQIYELMRQEDIMLGDWYSKPVSPTAVPNEVSCYIDHSCPTSEEISKKIFNLPTHINVSEEDAKYIVERLLELESNLVNDKS